MKRFLLLLTAVAVALAAVACAVEPLADVSAPEGGAPVAVSFDIGLQGALTKADGTPLDNGSGDFQLYVAAFDKEDGTLASESQIGVEGYADPATLSGGAASIKLTLDKKRSYRVVFFAMKAGAYTTSFSNNNSARIVISQKNLANDASMDAFYASVDVTPAKTSYDIELKRPFAQLNVLVPNGNVPEGKTAFKSAMKVKMPILFDLYSGRASETLAEVTFEANTIDTPAFGDYAGTHQWIGMNYVIVPAGGEVEVTSFQEDGMGAAIVPGKVPVQANQRTNLVGSLYEAGFDLSVTVEIDPGIDDPEIILEHKVPGCYFPDHTRSYVAGTDQIVREYDGSALTFALIDPAAREQLVVSGYQDTMKVGDAVTLSVDWRKGGEQQLSGSYEMSVVAIEKKTVWIADRRGNGFVIKK